MADTEVPHGDERGQIKCHRYWESGKYGPFEVKAYSEKHINIESNVLLPHNAPKVLHIVSNITSSMARGYHAHQMYQECRTFGALCGSKTLDYSFPSPQRLSEDR
jgi:hypothetical protein